MENIRKLIGSRIRQLRAGKKLTQVQMAKQLGVSPATVSGWEIGDFGISLETAFRITDFADVSLDWLLRGNNEPPVNLLPDNIYTPEEQRLIEAYQKLSKTSQAAILRVIEMMQK